MYLGGLSVFPIDLPAFLIHRIGADVDAVIGIPLSGNVPGEGPVHHRAEFKKIERVLNLFKNTGFCFDPAAIIELYLAVVIKQNYSEIFLRNSLLQLRPLHTHPTPVV